MPIYAYKCESCGQSRDVLQKISDPLLTVCPFCSEPTFVKQVTAAGFQLKGSGWYATDFKGGSTTAGAPAGTTGGDAGGDAGSKTADSPGTKEPSVTKAADVPAKKADSAPAAASGPREHGG